MSKSGKRVAASKSNADKLFVDTGVDDGNEIQTQLDDFIKMVGSRVIAERQRLGMSRRVLSELSGVSQRTIVLLETGVGNISIALLFRIAKALGHTVEWFIYTDDHSRQDSMRVADYYLTATPVQQQQIKNLLASVEEANIKQARICLIGLRGAGKSTLGRALSEKLSMPFVELNDEVESICGLSIQELMNLYGPEGYRRLERQALNKIVEERDNVILAAAGGVVSEEDNYSTLLKYFHTVWLKAKPEEHMERVKRQGDERPMEGNPAAMQELKSILVSRESLYSAADRQVDTSDKSAASSLEDLNDVVASLLAETNQVTQ